MLQGATPSPRMFELYPVIVYSLFIILLAGNVFNLAIGRLFAGLYARLGELPKPMLIPLILIMAIIGSYSFRGNPYDVIIMLVMGFVGYGLRLLGIPDAPLVITFLITPMMEANLRRALLISRGDWLQALLNSPLSIGLLISCIILTFLSIKFQVSQRLSMVQRGVEEATEIDG